MPPRLLFISAPPCFLSRRRLACENSNWVAEGTSGTEPERFTPQETRRFLLSEPRWGTADAEIKGDTKREASPG